MNGHLVRVLVADPQSLFRLAVRTALDAEPDFQVVADARDAGDAVAEAERTRPDIALLDAALPRPGVLRAIERISDRVPTCRVLVVAGEADEELLFSAVVAGAKAFVTKNRPLDQLLETARAVAAGEARIPAELLDGLLDRLVRHRGRQADIMRRISSLTRREREVLSILAKGGDNDAIAQALVISRQTARTHVHNVLAKLQVHSRLEAAALARQSQILEQLPR